MVAVSTRLIFTAEIQPSLTYCTSEIRFTIIKVEIHDVTVAGCQVELAMSKRTHAIVKIEASFISLRTDTKNRKPEKDIKTEKPLQLN